MERGGHILPADTFPICCINRQKSMDLEALHVCALREDAVFIQKCMQIILSFKLNLTALVLDFLYPLMDIHLSSKIVLDYFF